MLVIWNLTTKYKHKKSTIDCWCWCQKYVVSALKNVENVIKFRGLWRDLTFEKSFDIFVT